MARNTGSKKAFALAVSLFTVLLAMLYLIFAEDAAVVIEKLNAKLGYSDMVSVYSSKLEDGEIEIHVIDVGQGDSILVRSNYGNVLIDAGTSSSEADLKAHLDACGIKKLDYLICTHPHDDHIGGADMICDRYDVDTVLMTDLETSGYALDSLFDEIEEQGIPAEIPNLGDKYELRDMVFTVMGPTEYSDEYNDMSLVIKLTFGDTSFVFTGDAELPAEQAMLGYYNSGELDCDFLKVGHHGSDTSSSTAFLEAVTPSIAAISCGKGNDYGHPRGEVLERLAEAGCDTILRTDMLGTIVVSSDGSELTVVTDTLRK